MYVRHLLSLTNNHYFVKVFYLIIKTHQRAHVSAKYFITFLPNQLPSDNKKLSCASNPISKLEYLYSSGSTFLVTLTAPNKEFLNTKYLPTLNGSKFIL